TLLQTAFTIFQVSTGNRLGGDGFTLLDFYGDKALSYMLATGAAAGFGLTVDLNRGSGSDSDTKSFLNKANAAAALLFIAFIFSAVSSVFSSFSLPKRT
ncbi:CASP-like protein PIMP1, partial [Sesamum indicum]